ncbi:putative secreted protein (Por secretion system target) [Tenacibaculum sp. 190524A02b]|uniref:Secreted protein (Por secretion system target) n=1 Tax=Tenacibaculum vairaonense TaxID=3137860 RepID=A0ABP1F9X2_9FLAO
MKQITFLLCMLLIPITASWAQWTDLDPNNLPTSNTRDLSFSLDNNNVPYIAYIDGNNTNKLELKKYNGSVWESITIPNLTSVGLPFIKFDSNNTLYLAYTTQFSRIVVLKQNGNTWDTIGSKFDLESGQYFKYSLNFDNSNSPYVAYSDDNDNGYLVVKKFNGTAWGQVGSTLFSERSHKTSKLIFDNNIPYIAYVIDSKPYVKKYNGTTWELIGDTSAYNRVSQIDLQVSNNTPFLAFSYFGSSIFYLLEYNTNSWIDKSFSIGTYHLNLPKINIQDQTPYIFGFTLDINHNFRSSIAQKHNGTSWESFADGLGSIQTLNQYYDTTISNNGESTYIAFIDTSFRLVVKKHSSSTTINSFTGNTNNNWTEASNWSLNHLPTTEEDIEIPSGKTVLLDNIRATINNLTLEGTLIIGLNGLGQLTTNDINYQNGAITMYNQGSIIANGTITGFASIRAFYSKYNGQNLDATKWYLASLPIQGPTVKNVMDFSTLDTTTSTKGNVGFATYNNNAIGSSGWFYYKTTSNDLFYNTKGYAIKVSEESSVNYFSSSRHVGDLAPNINCAVNAGSKNNWNLLGNPYYASIPVNSNTGATTTFLSKFSDQLDPSYAAVYFWNPVTASYEVVNNASPAKYIKPMEGYFVMIKNTTNNLPFDKTLLAHEPMAPNRAYNEDINITLTLEEGKLQKQTFIKYLNNATNGLDVGYDAGLFNGDTSKTAIYTKLVSEGKGTPFALQCLAKEAVSNSNIPLGIKTEEGKELTIKAHSNNLPKGVRILLEDKETNTITDITDANSSYKATLTTKESKNRFYLHTTAKALSTEEIALDKINIVKLDANTLQLKGLKENATVNIYNVQGKLITNEKTTVSNTKVHIPSVATGVYLVTIKTATQQTTQKIIL